ncbi:MAG: GWxTD domain-containing protein [Bacteroidetes bacterium]|nr:GWxTD domain-containing protein [Bacteroidota bacterium]
MTRLIIFLGFGLFSLNVGLVFAQSDLLESGHQAFQEERYEDALEEFQQLSTENSELAEAHYMMFRVYFETPMFDESRAKRSLEKALDIEPDNVEYLVGWLNLHKIKSWGRLGDRLREARRINTARKILKLDSDNSDAHEELGKVYIRDFWRFRNAIMLPSVSYGYVGSVRDSDAPDYDELITGSADNPSGGITSPLDLPDLNPNEVFLGDQFNMERLRSQGVNVVDLSKRAERAYLRAIGHFEKVLETDPKRRSVYDEMMRIYALKGEYLDAMGTLNLMYEYFPEDPDLWRYFGISNYKLGNMAVANRAFETAFKFMDEGEKRAYEDLQLFLTGEEKNLAEINPVEYHAQFWDSQDPRFLTPFNERKLEHYFRVTYADLLYASEGLSLRGWETERGQILIRYGTPDSDIVLHPQEDGVFTARQAVVGAMVNSITEVADTNQLAPTVVEGDQSFGTVYSTARQAFEQMNAYNIWEYGDFRFVFEDPFRNGEYRMYSPSAEEMSQRINSYLNDYVQITKEVIRETPQRYEYIAPGRQIEVPFLVSSFKGEGEQTDIAVSYGIPIESTFDSSEDLIDVTASTGTFIVNDQREIIVGRHRTIYGFPTNQIVSFEEQNLWIDTQEIEAPNGTHELSLEFETASGQTVAVQRREIIVPNYSQEGLMLSDVLLAYSVEDTEDGQPLSAPEIVRNDLSILPAPWSVYSTDQPVYLYFELYGLTQNSEGNTSYSIEITLDPKSTDRGVRNAVRRLFGRGQKGVSVSYEGTGGNPEESLYQILDIKEQETGLYTLTLQVEDLVTGQNTKRTQDLFLE